MLFKVPMNLSAITCFPSLCVEYISMSFFSSHDFIEKPFLPDSCNTNNKNDNPNINILMSENIRQKRLKILEYFDAYICHHFQPNDDNDNDDKYMHLNIPRFLVFFVRYFLTLRC